MCSLVFDATACEDFGVEYISGVTSHFLEVLLSRAPAEGPGEPDKQAAQTSSSTNINTHLVTTPTTKAASHEKDLA